MADDQEHFTHDKHMLSRVTQVQQWVLMKEKHDSKRHKEHQGETGNTGFTPTGQHATMKKGQGYYNYIPCQSGQVTSNNMA